jgi:hypothetical protein
VLAAAAVQQGGHIAGQVGGGRVDAAAAGGHDLAIGDRLEATGTQHIPGGQVGPDPLGADQVGVVHPQGVEDALAQVLIERLAADVLDQLAQGGEPVVGVPPPGARLDLHG